MKYFLSSSVVLLLACAPAFATDTIFASSESQNAAPGADAQSISLEGFNGGVSTADTHDAGGSGGMMIQMLMPSTGSAAPPTPGPYVAHVAVTNTH